MAWYNETWYEITGTNGDFYTGDEVRPSIPNSVRKYINFLADTFEMPVEYLEDAIIGCYPTESVYDEEYGYYDEYIPVEDILYEHIQEFAEEALAAAVENLDFDKENYPETYKEIISKPDYEKAFDIDRFI